ncbi:MAG: hypothetical protein ACXW5U_01755 [Thermoanaerobaculia bacterium]
MASCYAVMRAAVLALFFALPVFAAPLRLHVTVARVISSVPAPCRCS